NRVSFCHPGWSAVVQSRLTATSTCQVQGDSLASASLVAGITGAHHHDWLVFVLLVDTGFHYVDQAGLKLLTSSDLPASASQSAGITGMATVPGPGLLFDDHSILTCSTQQAISKSRLNKSFYYYHYYYRYYPPSLKLRMQQMRRRGHLAPRWLILPECC
uniref:Uncharacterized protein n=2 Tax=Macaca TaxID=9539 RepID=A0A5F8AKR8_MACMU